MGSELDFRLRQNFLFLLSVDYEVAAEIRHGPLTSRGERKFREILSRFHLGSFMSELALLFIHEDEGKFQVGMETVCSLHFSAEDHGIYKSDLLRAFSQFSNS